MINKKPLPKSKFPMYYNANENILDKAKELRDTETRAEKLLWDQLRAKKLSGFKFRRQHAIERFIADFYCHKAKLVIEVDGGIHNKPEVEERDKNRTAEIDKYDINIIRFTNQEIFNSMDKVIEKIKSELEKNRNEE